MSDGRLLAGDSSIVLEPGDAAATERPLLNHLGLRVESADNHIEEAERRGLEIADIVDAENTYAVFVWGRTRSSSSTSSTSRRSPSPRPPVPALLVAGAGMAGLVAAARARELGADVVVHEKGDRPGGSMLLLLLRRLALSGLGRLQGRVPRRRPRPPARGLGGLDDALAWPSPSEAPVVTRDGSAHHGGALRPARTDGGSGKRRTARRAADRDPEEHPDDPRHRRLPGRPRARRPLRDRGTPRAARDPGARATVSARARERGARLSTGLASSTGATSPPRRIEPEDFVPLAQVYARHAVVENARGERFEARTWSEIGRRPVDGRQPGARLVSCRTMRSASRARANGRRVIEAAASAGAPVERHNGATRASRSSPHHHDARRHPKWTSAPGPPTASGRRAPMSAGSPPAAGRARSRRPRPRHDRRRGRARLGAYAVWR